jgi:hypothetical protein
MFSVQPKVLIGYTFPNRPTTLSIETSGVFRIRSLEQSFNVQGLWTELVVPIRCPSPIGFAMSLGYLFPTNYGSEEKYNTSDPGVAARTWATSTQMVNFQVAATYRFSQSITGIVGFRYDSFMTNFASPVVVSQLPNPLTLNQHQRATLTVSGDIPFFGGMIERDLMNGVNIKAGAIGLPTLPGDISYKETIGTNRGLINGESVSVPREFRSGYFLEGFGELSIPFSRWFEIGAFAKYSGIYGRATQADVTYHVKTEIEKDVDLPSVTANLIFDRSSWIFGGTVSASF